MSRRGRTTGAAPGTDLLRERARVLRRLADLVEDSDLRHSTIEDRGAMSRGYLTQVLNGRIGLKLWHVLAILRGVGVAPERFFAGLYPRRRRPPPPPRRRPPDLGGEVDPRLAPREPPRRRGGIRRAGWPEPPDPAEPPVDTGRGPRPPLARRPPARDLSTLRERVSIAVFAVTAVAELGERLARCEVLLGLAEDATDAGRQP